MNITLPTSRTKSSFLMGITGAVNLQWLKTDFGSFAASVKQTEI